MCPEPRRRRFRGLSLLIALGAAAALPARAQDTAATHGMGHGMGHGMEEMTWQPTLFVLFDQLEYAPAARGEPFNVDMRAWYGGARQRLWVLAESEFASRVEQGEAEVQVAYGRLVDPFWDATIGLRIDPHWGDAHPGRTQLAVGLRGLAPYRVEFEPTLFVSPRGEFSGRLEGSFQLQFTQRLIAEPEFEVNAALQAAPRFGVRRGLNDFEYGVRVRYELRREFAPYVGWSRSRRIAGSTNIGRPSGDPLAESRLVLGLRVWR